MQTLRPYDAYRKVEILDDLWTLKRNGRTLRVQLRTHPLGWELQALVGGELHRSQVAKTPQEVSDLSEKWKSEAFAKGWSDAEASRQ
jgi:hypothetical protein